GAAILAGAAIGVVAVLAILAAFSGDEEETPAAPDASPTVGATATPPPTANPCAPGNLVNGFLVLEEGEPVPECVQQGQPLTPGERTYELAVPPGNYAQTPIEGQTPDDNVVGWRYTLGGAPAFVITRTWRDTTEPPIVRAADVEPADVLPGPGLTFERDGAAVASWLEEGASGVYRIMYTLEVHPNTGLSLEQAASLLAFFGGTSAVYWNPETRE